MTENKYAADAGTADDDCRREEAMLRDWCTWDRDYNDLVESCAATLSKWRCATARSAPVIPRC
ncbi:MAG: hypothetical protein ACLUEQ_04545 [Cloacibacillus evryensis]